MERRNVGAKGDIYQGMGDGLARAFELALTPAIFGFGGWWLDRWLGVLPLFTIVLTLLTIVGLAARTWYGYDYRMRQIEARSPWAPRQDAP